MARMLPEKPSWCRNVGPSGRAKSVKRFERSNGLDTALYKKNLYLFLLNEAFELYKKLVEAMSS